MKLYFIFFFILIFNYRVKASDDVKLYLVINVFSCSSCNQTAEFLKDRKEISKRFEVLFSSEDVTTIQAKEFVNEIFKGDYPIKLDASLFNRIAKEIYYFKEPHLVIYNQKFDRIEKLFPIDSIDYNMDFLNAFFLSASDHQSKISIDRIKKQVGYKKIAKIGNQFFILPSQRTSTLFHYNLKSMKLDSIYFSDSLAKSILEFVGIKNADIQSLNRYYRAKLLPYKLMSFNTDWKVDGSKLNVDIEVLYVDPKTYSDTSAPTWYSLIMTIDTKSGAMKIYNYKYWQSGDDWESSELVQEFAYKQFAGQFWYFSGEKRTKDLNSKTKLLLRFKKDSGSNSYVFDSIIKEIKVDSLYDFQLKHMNEDHFEYKYDIVGPYIFFESSPIITNFINNSRVNLLNIDTTINWVYDLRISTNLIQIIVRDKANQLWRLNFDRSSEMFMNKIALGEKLKGSSNIILDNGKVYYINKSGDIICVD